MVTSAYNQIQNIQPLYQAHTFICNKIAQADLDDKFVIILQKQAYYKSSKPYEAQNQLGFPDR